MAEQARARTSTSYTASLRKFLCPADKAALVDLKARNVKITAYDDIYFEDPYYDGRQWKTKRWPAGGSEGDGEINIKRTNAANDAATLYHEAIHGRQPATMSRRDKELEAYTLTEEWRISHGLPPYRSDFRSMKGGKPSVNHLAIKGYVDLTYPGVAVAAAQPMPAPGAKVAPSAPADQIVGRNKAGETLLQRSDGTQYARPPRKGDAYPGPEVLVPKEGIPVDVDELQCR